MKKLTVIYDEKINDKYRNQYLNLIKKQIKNVEIIDFRKINNLKDFEKVLILEPINLKFKNKIKEEIKNKDIEGSYTDKLTITAEAIIEVLPKDLTNKTVIIINQSDVLGKPLAKELINLGANVFSLNSSFDEILITLYHLTPDILISASGNNNFKISNYFLKNIKTIVDLSNDIDFKNTITSIPTIEVLKKRLKKL